MDFIRIIRSLEEFIYELAVWIILIPKTFFKILISPKWINDFVAVIIEAIKEQQNEIQSQQNLIKNLNRRIEYLESN